jgi:hypothetical protein
MSQTPIREYDAKHIVYTQLDMPYHGYLVQSIADLEKSQTDNESSSLINFLVNVENTVLLV